MKGRPVPSLGFYGARGDDDGRSEALTEAELQAAVLELAGITGWLRAHFRPARTNQGWRTPTAADAKGFPDLVLVKPPRLLFVELKGDRGKLAPEQFEWLQRLRGCATLASKIEVHVWTPGSWLTGEVQEALT